MNNPRLPFNGFFILLWLAGILLAAFFGLLIAAEAYPFVLVFLLAICGPMLVLFRKIGMWVVIVSALVFSGLIDLYLSALQPLKWGVGLLSTMLALYVMGQSLLSRQPVSNSSKIPTLFWWLVMFVLSVLLSITLNWGGFVGLAVGLKGYFQIWGLLLTIYFLMDDEVDAGKLIRFLPILGLIQLPFVLHQFIALVPLRSGVVAAEHGVVAVDVVAGTFGGSMFGGGRSPSLALLIAICITLLIAYVRSKQMGALKALLLGLILFSPVLLSETKVVVVLFPVMFLLLFRDVIVKNPLKAAVGFFAISVFMYLILTIYVLLPGAQTHQERSLENLYKETVEYNVGKRGYGNLILNRTNVYTFWLTEHSRLNTIPNALIGHGPGATNADSAFVDNSLASKQYKGYGIGLTGIAALLWELGLAGLICVVGLLISAYRLGGRLAQQWQGTQHWALLKTAQISMPLFAVNLFHNNYFVVDLSFQALFVILLGYLLVMTRFSRKNQ